MGKTAFITGITGQDGSYLAELLLEKGYEVHGLVRRNSLERFPRIETIRKDVTLYYGDLSDTGNLHQILNKVQPDEVYHLGAQSHVGISFEMPEYTADVTGEGSLRLLEVLRTCVPGCKYYQASTSELFGGIPGTAPQNEKTPFYPKSPYGAAKLYAYWITVNYRESYQMFACNGILFNHESPRRGENFVTRKITLAANAIVAGRQEKLTLGNLDSKRDWGFAGDYVEGMWRILQQDKPGDYVLATGVRHTVREFCEAAFSCIGIELRWEGHGVEEKGYDTRNGNLLIDVDPEMFRPAEVEELCGDASLAEKELGWRRKVDFESLVRMMMESDRKYSA